MRETKEYLEQVERLDIMISSAQRKIEKLKGVATSTSASMGGERVTSSGNHGKMADAVIGYLDIEEEEIEPLKRKREAILQNVKRVKGRLAFIVLYEHYFNGKDFKRIAAEKCYSYSHVKRAHGEGLAELQRIINKYDTK